MKHLLLFLVLTLFLNARAEILNLKKLKESDIQHHTIETQYKDLPIDISEYNYLDPKHLVPTEPLTQALRFFKGYKNNILNQNYLTIIDMSQHSSKKRMYVVSLSTGEVVTYLTAHGKKSDKNNDGYAESFSNVDGSLMSSLGFYLTGVTYSGNHGLSLKLHGLQNTNSNAYDRAIVMHGADYVNSGYVGRSFGCPAIENKYVKTLIPALKNKSLLYIYKK